MFRALGRTYREAFSGLPRPVWLLAIASLVNRSGTMVLPFLTLFLTEQRGFSTEGAGRALAVYGVGAVAGSWLGGWLSDRIDPRRIMVWSLVGTGAGFFAVGYVSDRTGILGLIVIVSTIGETFRPANSAAVAAASPPEVRTRGFALARLAVNIGMSLGPAIGGVLALYDYYWLFVVDGSTCLAAAAFLLIFFPQARRAAPEPVEMKESPAATADRKGAAVSGNGVAPWRDPSFLFLMLLSFLLASVTFQLLSTFPLTLRDLYLLKENWVGLTFAINTLIIITLEMVLVHRLGERDPLQVVAIGSFLSCVGFGLMPLGADLGLGYGYIAATTVIWTVGEMLSLPFLSGIVASRAAEGNVGRSMGFYITMFSAAFVSAPLAGTWIYSRFGAHAIWYGCAALGPPLAAGFYALSIRRPAPLPVPSPEEG